MLQSRKFVRRKYLCSSGQPVLTRHGDWTKSSSREFPHVWEVGGYIGSGVGFPSEKMKCQWRISFESSQAL